MNEDLFLSKRKPDWTRLDYLSQKLSSAPKKMTREEIEEFITLYQKTSGDLAKARSESTNLDLINSLNTMVARAYAELYRKPVTPARHAILDGILFAACAFRRQFRFVLAAVATVLFFTTISSVALTYRPEVRSSLVSEQEEQLFAEWRKGQFPEKDADTSAQMWAFYASNNPLVSTLWAAGGAGTFGTFSAYGLAKLGFQLGSLGWDMNSVGKLPFFLSSIAPHGASELSGAMISGATGYLMGWTLISPGRRKRSDALRSISKDAFALFVMGVLMMYIAAPFEAFISFQPSVPQALKAIIGCLVFAGWCSYWALAGRGRPEFANAGDETVFEEGNLQPNERRS